MSRYVDIDAITKDIETFKNSFVINWHYLDGESVVCTAPTADVRENIRGEWIKISSNLYKCSECGRVVEKDLMEDVQIDYPFCHCGADMRGEENE